MTMLRISCLPLACLAAFAAMPARAGADACQAKADALLDALAKHDYDAAARPMDEHMRQISLPKTLPGMWEAMTKGPLGAYVSHGTATIAHPSADLTTLSLPLKFEKISMTGNFTCKASAGGGVDEFVLD